MSIFSDAEARVSSQFFRVGGETVTYRRKPARPSVGPPQPITIGSPDPTVEQLYDLPAIWREDEAARGRQGIQASAWCLLSDFATFQFDPSKGDSITRNGRNYVVAEDPRDSMDFVAGSVTLYLRFNN